MRCFLFLLVPTLLLAQRPNTNFDETKVGKSPLPGVFGSAKTSQDWPARRAEILKLYETHVFGRIIDQKIATKTEQTAKGPNWKQIRFTFSGNGREKSVTTLLVIPPKAKKPVPVVICLSFTPIQTVLDGHTRWPLDLFAKYGYAVFTAHYTDFFPDVKDGLPNSVLALMPENNAPDAPNAISAWAWGMSRMLDYAQTEKDLDPKRIAVAGHSRLGKAALWAGAADTRFAAVISNNSGEGGAALSRRIFGEHIADLNKSFPHWFNTNFKGFSQSVEELPVDSHMLLALAAPRPLYVASASDDLWADPMGELMGLTEANRVYEMLGVPERTGYHLRPGKHNITAYDWERFLRFLNNTLK